MRRLYRVHLIGIILFAFALRRMTFHEPYTGLVRIGVGLYDPATMERVPIEGDERTLVLLPTTLTVRDN